MHAGKNDNGKVARGITSEAIFKCGNALLSAMLYGETCDDDRFARDK